MTQIIQVRPKGDIKETKGTFPVSFSKRMKRNKKGTILKKLHHAKLTKFAGRAKDKPMSTREILGEIQKYRKERKNRA